MQKGNICGRVRCANSGRREDLLLDCEVLLGAREELSKKADSFNNNASGNLDNNVIQVDKSIDKPSQQAMKM